MVIGQQQAFRGNELARTAAAEKDDRILERSLVDAVDIFRAEFEALGLHVGDTPADQRGQPHPFVRPQRRRKEQRKQESQIQFSHSKSEFLPIYEKK